LAFDEQEIHQAPKQNDGNADGSLNKHAGEDIWYGLGDFDSMSEPKESSAATDAEVKFAADRMLGKLAKWLRVLGCDVIYGPHLTGYGLIRAARAEQRKILTRDRRLKQKQPPPFIFIESDHHRDQLRQVIRSCGIELAGNKLLSRCLKDNTALQRMPKETVEPLVPAYVFATQENFSWCSRCRRVYWPATHQQKMVEELTNIAVR
jgi:uncharacterized protein with PIN domain